MKNLNSALFHATSELTSISKDTKGHYGSYASLDKVMDHVKPVLIKHGLFIHHLIKFIPGTPPLNALITRIVYTDSGEFIESEVGLLADKPGPQGQGAAITYLRRYSIMAMLGLPTEDDPDSGHFVASRPAYKPPPQYPAPMIMMGDGDFALSPPPWLNEESQIEQESSICGCGNKMMISKFPNKQGSYDWYCGKCKKSFPRITA